MVWTKFGKLAVASAFVLATMGAGATSAFAMHMDASSGSDLASDVRAGETGGQIATVNDEDKAAEFDVDDGQVVEDVETDNGDANTTNGSNS